MSSARQGGMKRKRVPVKENLPVKEKKPRCEEEITSPNTSDERLPLTELSGIHINETVENRVFSVFSRCKKACPIPSTQNIDGNLLWKFYLRKDSECSEARTSYLFTSNPSIQPRMRSVLLEWLIEVCDVVQGTLLKVQKIFRGKAASFAKSKMEEADHWLKKEKYDRALVSANLAVVRAPSSYKGKKLPAGEASILPMSLLIRSEILFKMSEFQLCLNDLQLVLKYCLSDNQKTVTYLRMGLCYLKLGDKNKSKISFTVAISCGSAEMKEEAQKYLNNLDKNLETPVKKLNQDPIVIDCADDHPGVSKKVVMATDKGSGRYFKAANPIAVGDIVSCEEPVVSALLFDKHGTHCLHCFQRLKSPIPCPNCSGVAFCSVNCLNEGLKYHKWECPYLELSIGSGMSILSFLSLRMITQQSIGYFKPNEQNKEAKSCEKVLNLIGHSDKRDAQDFLHRTLMALFLLQLLRHGGYFNKKINKVSVEDPSSSNEGIVLTEEELKIGTLLLKFLQILQYNAHEIYETVFPKDDNKTKGVTCYVALGVYPSSAIFNHECQPTLARYFSGKKIVLRAQRPIDVNQLVSENYGPIFTMKTKDQRQKMLKGRYLFDCKCVACIQDWPKLEDMTPERNYYRCQDQSCQGIVIDNIPCGSCGSRNLEDAKLLYDTYQKDWERCVLLITNGKFKEAEKVVIEYVESMCKLVSQPSKNLCLAMEALRTIWANTNGNVAVLQTSKQVEAKVNK